MFRHCTMVLGVLSVVFSGVGLVSAVVPAYQLVRTIGSSGTGNYQFNQPWGLAVDSLGNVFVADNGNNRVQEFDSSGIYLRTIGSGSFSNLQGVDVDSGGNVWVPDTGHNLIKKYSPTGLLLSQFGTHGSGDGQLDGPYDLHVDKSGNVWVVDWWNNRIEEFDGNGNYRLKFGSSGNGNGQFSWLQGINEDLSGNIWVADGSNNRLQEFYVYGNYLTQVGTYGSGNGKLNGPSDVAFDASGNMWVTDYWNNRVEGFDASGNYLTQFANGLLYQPKGIAIDPAGNLWVADKGNNRILEFSPVPEPATLVLLGIGGVTLLTFAWRRRRGRAPFETVLKLSAFSGAIAAAVFAQSAHGTTIAYDGFNYPAGSSLAGQNGGQGFSGAWYQGGFNVSTSAGTLESGSLAYSPLATTGNQLTIPAKGNLNGLERNFASSISSGTVYISYALCPEGGFYGIASGCNGIYLHGSLNDLFFGNSGINGKYAMEQRGGNGEVTSSVVPVVGQTEFLVLKAQLLSGNDVFTLYTNPTPGAPEPSTGLVKSDLDIGSLSNLVIYSGLASNLGGAFNYDEIRVGTTYADVTPIPEPSTLALLGVGAISLLGYALRRRRRTA
jgi:streptogramin lyase